jgi:sugar lactone lactonase YvrE
LIAAPASTVASREARLVILRPRWAAAILAVLTLSFVAAQVSHAYVLVGDRLTNRILKYSNGGSFLGVVVDDDANLGSGSGNNIGISAVTLSPDLTQLYVGTLDNKVVRYDFNGTTATNPAVYTSNGASTISGPGGLLFSQSGSTLYVANRGAFANLTTVAQLDANGVSAGANLTGGPTTGRTGLAYDPNGTLLVGAFGSNFSPTGAPGGGVLKFDSGSNSFVDLVPQNTALAGTSGLLVNGNDLYVVASVSTNFFQGVVGKFNATTGAVDGSFGTGGYVTPEVSFPASITASADGSGFLLGMLNAVVNGGGRVDRYGFDGAQLGVWASPVSAVDEALGFREATALLTVVPEPATLTGAFVALVTLGGIARRVRR